MGELIELRAHRSPVETAQDTIAAAVLAAGGRDHLARHLSATLGVSVFGSTIRAWETGVASPPEDVLRAVSELASRVPEPAVPLFTGVHAVASRAVPARADVVVPELGPGQDLLVSLEYPPTAEAARLAATALWAALAGGRSRDVPWVSEAATGAGWSWSFDPPDGTARGPD